jgi:hypothetical protein
MQGSVAPPHLAQQVAQIVYHGPGETDPMLGFSSQVQKELAARNVQIMPMAQPQYAVAHPAQHAMQPQYAMQQQVAHAQPVQHMHAAQPAPVAHHAPAAAAPAAGAFAARPDLLARADGGISFG